jgi:aldehyde:ferredoxin oxidoreductase
VYLWIQDGQPELRDASHLWGKLSGDVHEILMTETNRQARILQCGIAGERGNLMANIVSDLRHFNGRGGLGAVMGSKRLRAIAVHGHDRVEPEDREGFQAAARWFHEHYDRANDMLHMYGTSRNVVTMNAEGILPTHNFREGQFELAKEISGQTLAQTILKHRGTCYACAFACKRDVEVQGRQVSARYGGPASETYRRLPSSIKSVDST